MFVVVLTDRDRAAGAAGTAADASAGKAGCVKQKVHSSKRAHGADSNDDNTGCAAAKVRDVAGLDVSQ